MDGNIKKIAAGVWKELQDASHVEAPTNIKPFSDDIVKREDPTTKVLVDINRPSEINPDEFKSLLEKYYWSS
jgi:hypothetical protein